MDYRFVFEDGSESLMHHGIKGMKWGVWNAETSKRYGHRNSIRKGTKFKRITYAADKKAKLDSPTYVSTNKSDYKEYLNVASFLPSVKNSKGYKDRGEFDVITMKSKKKMQVANGDDVAQYILDKYGDTKMSDLKAATRSGGSIYAMLSGAVAKENNPTVREYHKAHVSEKPYPESTRTKGEIAVYELFANKVGSFEKANTGSRKNKDEMVEYFKSKGYDAIVDYEDYSSPHIDVKEPLLILDPSNTVKVTRRKTVAK